MDNEEKFYLDVSIKMLSLLGITKPKKKNITLMRNLLFNTWLKRKVIFNTFLTNQEKFCLLLASHGKTTKEIARALEISPGTAQSYSKQILKKLGVTNMKQAIAIGIKYGELA